MSPTEITALMRAVSDAVGERMEKLLARIETLEARAPEPGAPGQDGAPGPAGKDGISLDDFAASLDERGVLTLSLQAGDRIVRREIALPILRDAGVYRAGESYGKGAAVTYAGSLWIAQKETGVKPGEGTDWRLAVKRGKDGRDAALAA